MIFFEAELKPFSEGKVQRRGFWAIQYPANIEETQVGAAGEVAIIDVLNDAFNGEVDWDLANLTWGTDLGSSVSICIDYVRHHEIVQW